MEIEPGTIISRQHHYPWYPTRPFTSCLVVVPLFIAVLLLLHMNCVPCPLAKWMLSMLLIL